VTIMKIKVKISLADGRDEEFMGIGLVWLLRRIKKFKSPAAARLMTGDL